MQTFIPGMMGLYGWKPGSPGHPEMPVYEGCRNLIYTYHTTSDAVASVIPEPLRPGPEPFVMVVVMDIPLWRALDAAHYGSDGSFQYREAMVLVQCEYRGEVGITLASIYIGARNGDFSNGPDVALALGREFLGNPKKFAHINIDLNGDEWVATVDRQRTRLLEFHGRFDEEIAPTDWMRSIGRFFCVREFLAPDFTKYDVRQVLAWRPTLFSHPERLWRGNGSIELGHLDQDPLDALPMVKPGQAFQSIWRLVDEVEALEVFELEKELTSA